MKITFFNSFYNPIIEGGAEITLEILATRLAQRGHHVSVVCTREEPGMGVDWVEGVPVYRLGIDNLYWPRTTARHSLPAKLLWHAKDANNRAMGRQVGALLDDLQPDIASCHNLAGFSVNVWQQLAQRGIVTVQVLHDYYTLCTSSTLYASGRNCGLREQRCVRCRVLRSGHAARSNAVTAVVGVSQFVLDRHLHSGMFAQARVQRVINNARDIPRQPVQKVPVGSGQATGLRLGYLGRVVASKGVEHLCRVFADFVAARPGSHTLTFAGAGEATYVQQLQQAFGTLGVRFDGRRAAAEFFREIDVLVVPSLWHDPYPGVVYEALAAGVPVLGSRRGGIHEILKDGIGGFLFEPDAEGQLARILCLLADDPRVLETLSITARESVARLLNVDRMVDEYEQLYAQMFEQTTASQNAGRDPTDAPP